MSISPYVISDVNLESCSVSVFYMEIKNGTHSLCFLVKLKLNAKNLMEYHFMKIQAILSYMQMMRLIFNIMDDNMGT